MRIIKWIGIGCALALLTACFFPWVTIEARSIVITGVYAQHTNWGKPGSWHFVFATLYIAFALVNKTWSVRGNLVITALNLAWALRNFILMGNCEMGECPVKHTALYIVLFTSICMLLTTLFSGVRVPNSETKP
ncbi:MAG: hypothetical protein ICV66_09345 [Chitinophagaceae bacterium]|nr:hypothetical protein [Chitinophagaceae bacterium]